MKMCYCVNLGWPQVWIQFIQPNLGLTTRIVVEIDCKTKVVTRCYRAEKPHQGVKEKHWLKLPTIY